MRECLGQQSSKRPRAGKDKGASKLGLILEEFEDRFKARSVQREMDAKADGDEVSTYDSRIGDALTWLVVEHLCDDEQVGFIKEAASDSGDGVEQHLEKLLLLSPFRQQFDNFASLITLHVSAKGMSFEGLISGLADNVLANMPEDTVEPETLQAVLGALRSSFKIR